MLIVTVHLALAGVFVLSSSVVEIGVKEPAGLLTEWLNLWYHP